jgi:hypothetical protein
MIKDVIIHDIEVKTVMEDPVVAAAQVAFSARIKGSSDVSHNSKLYGPFGPKRAVLRNARYKDGTT